MVVVVMLLLVIGIAIGGAALTETLASRSQASRDVRVKRALQAADAGLATELYRANQLNLSTLNLSGGPINWSQVLHDLLVCPVPVVVSGQIGPLAFVQASASTGNPCPSNSGSGVTNPGPTHEPVGNHSYFDARFVPAASAVGDFRQLAPKIVALGVDDNGNAADSNRYVVRRVEAVLAPIDPFHALEANHDLTVNVPTATTFNGTARAGHNLTLVGTGLLGLGTLTGLNLTLSGGLLAPTALDYGCTFTPNSVIRVTLGNFTQVPSGGNCSSPFFSRPTISISPSKANCSSSCPASGYSGGNQDEIYITNGSSVTFAPGDYVLCSFQTNGPVNVNPTATAPVRIFIDSPSSNRCKDFKNHTSPPAGFKAAPGNFIATQGIGNLLAATHPSQAQVYVVGNGTNDGTTVTSTESGLSLGQAFFLYAPTSSVNLSSAALLGLGGTLAGAYVGYDLTVSATVITQDLGLLNYPLSASLGVFHVQQYIDCSTMSVSQFDSASNDPTSGC
jgi:hypothetical protein